MIISNCRKIVGGTGEGNMLVTNEPINFLAMLDAKTGKVTDHRHQLHGRSIKGMVLALPYSIGSSVGAYAIYSLRQNGTAPNAVVCIKTDITIASGCAISNIPAVDLPKGVKLETLRDKLTVRVEADGGRIIIP
ncbi:MAG TPA: DUF126 domain-containing protein [Nitrososphaera sp.]